MKLNYYTVNNYKNIMMLH